MLMTKIYELAMCGDASIRGAKVTGLDTTNNALLVSRSSRPFLPSAPTVKRDREEMCNHESGPRGCTRRACPYEHVLEETRGTGLRHRRALNQFLGFTLPQEAASGVDAKRQRTSPSPNSRQARSPQRRRDDRPDRRRDDRQDRRQDRRPDQRRGRDDRRSFQPQAQPRHPAGTSAVQPQAKITELRQ